MHAVNVTATASMIVAAGNRAFVHIINTDDENIVYVKYDGSATALTVSNGWPIPAGGMLILANENHNIYTAAIYAITSLDVTVALRIQGGAEP